MTKMFDVDASQYPQLGGELAKAQDQFLGSLSALNTDQRLRDFYAAMILPNGPDWIRQIKGHAKKHLGVANKISKAFRNNTRAKEFPTLSLPGLAKSAFGKDLTISKAELDVGTLTNFAQITGGQSLGYVSLDTQMARGTVRPNSFTLYQALHKSAAFQVVDYWAYASDTGGGLPGTAFTGYTSVQTGTLTTSAGVYNLQNITLKLALNGRAITTALAAQNSFVDVTQQENVNAALTVLSSINWACYWGNPAIYSNQFQGIYGSLLAGNIFDFSTFYNNNAAAQGWSYEQTMYNLIYEAAGQITSYGIYGRVTHAFMTPVTAGALQSLVTSVLNNLTAGLGTTAANQQIVVNGELTGMRTRYGEIQFPMDLFITARDKPAQAILNSDGTNNATTTSPAPVTSVVGTLVSTGASANGWTASYTAASGIYSYAVAATDVNMNESTLKYLASGAGVSTGLSVSGVSATTGYQLTITPSESTDAAFRVYRSGLGYSQTTSGAFNPASFRYVGTVAANAGSAVTFVDRNVLIPGSETVFLLDMDENDMAIDYRFLLPLTRIELFAQNLYCPWAVAQIGAIRLKVAKFHGAVINYVPTGTSFSPLAPNPAAT